MKKTHLADLILLGVTFTWGATFVLVKEAIQKMPPFTFLGIRFVTAGILLILFMFAYCRKSVKLFTKQVWLPGICLGFWLFAGYAFQTIGLEFTTASKGGFITGLSVVMVPFFSLWLLGQPLNRMAMFGVMIALAGLTLLSLGKDSSISIGDVLVFFCAISYALHITFVGRYAPKFPALLLAAIQILACGILNLICAGLFEHRHGVFSTSILLDKWVLSALLICTLIATAVAFAAQNYFQKFTSPTRTALIFATEPVFAAVTGYLWAGDRFTTQQVVGCVLILVGMLVSELAPGPKVN